MYENGIYYIYIIVYDMIHRLWYIIYWYFQNVTAYKVLINLLMSYILANPQKTSIYKWSAITNPKIERSFKSSKHISIALSSLKDTYRISCQFYSLISKFYSQITDLPFWKKRLHGFDVEMFDCFLHPAFSPSFISDLIRRNFREWNSVWF